jgi:hypothetical protein
VKVRVKGIKRERVRERERERREESNTNDECLFVRKRKKADRKKRSLRFSSREHDERRKRK